MTSDRLAETVDQLRHFAADRGWEGLHNPKNLAMALAGEAGELVAELQWKTPDESESSALAADELASIQGEMADVAIYLLLLADRLGFDVLDAVAAKIGQNVLRFPAQLRDGETT